MTLQKLCLKRIAESIDLYSRAYTTVDNQYLQQGFYILQKIYSHELISSLTNKGLLKEDHADLVFNEHIKSIDTEWFSNYTWKKIMEIFTRIGPFIERITFSKRFPYHGQEAIAFKKVIRLLPNVKAVTYKKRCHDDFLQCITENCQGVETVDVRNSRCVTDEGILHFCKIRMGQKRNSRGRCISWSGVPCPQLKVIRLGETNVTPRGVQPLLQKLPSLVRIDSPVLLYVLQVIYMANTGKRYKLERLTHIDLSYVSFRSEDARDSLEACSDLCPSLKSLFFPVKQLEYLKMLSLFSYVTSFELDFERKEGTCAAEVKDFLKEYGEKVTSLAFRGCTVMISLLGQYCPRLNQLRLEEVTIDCDEDESVPVLRSLKKFIVVVDMASASIQEICRILRSSPFLEYFDFDTIRFQIIPSAVEEEIVKCCDQCSLEYISICSLKYKRECSCSLI